MRILADENIPGSVVKALQRAGHDVTWIRAEHQGLPDQEVLMRAIAERRVLFTFDKDFGELAFRVKLPSDCGIILFRLSLPSPEEVANRILAIVEERDDWVGCFAVIDDVKIRVRSLPGVNPDELTESLSE